jgi:Integrase core domain
VHRSSAVQLTAHANAYVERVIGSIRRECLDHVIVVKATGLHRVLTHYVGYYMRSRTHLALGKDRPMTRQVQPPSDGHIVAVPQSVGCTIATIASLSEETRRRGARSPWAPGSAGRPQSALGGDARGLL